MTELTAEGNGTIETHTVGTGDDAVTYDVRGDLATATPDRPVLFLIGSPMDATGFGTLASHFTDRPAVTYDPRGAGRNPTGTDPIATEQHADDLHRVIEALGVGPVDVFASSGGAVNALALIAAHPERRPPGGGPRAADGRVAARQGRRPRRLPRHAGDVRPRGQPPRDGQVHPVRDVRRHRHRRPTSTSPPPTRRCSGCPTWTTALAPTR